MLRRASLTLGAIAALVIAARSSNDAVRFTATLLGATCMSFMVTTTILERERERKNQQAIADAYLEFLRNMEQHDLPIRQSQRPSVCRGCCHYHGRIYSGNLFVCGMHPYGVDSDVCEDWNLGKDSRDRIA